MKVFANRIKELRKERGFTQEAFAETLGITRSAVGNYEQGTREPDFETLEAIADVLNCDIEYLIGTKSRSDLTLDERFVVEAMRRDSTLNERILKYAETLIKEGRQ